MQQKIVSRDTRIDSAKGVLIVFVVFGHVLEIFLARSPLYAAICSGIYIFHMPLFVMIAGMFSKSSLDDRGYGAIFTRLIVPLVTFQCLYLGLIALKSGHLATPLLQPHWILWFLMSMVIWKLALPLFARLPFAVPMSFAITIAAGFNDEIGYAFSLSRSLYFFPFFLIGHLHGKQIMACAAQYRGVLVSVFFAIIAGIIWWSFNGLPHDALYGSKGYAFAPVIVAAPAVGRAFILVLSLAASVGALALVNAGSWGFLTYLGRRSLTIFVLHGFAVMVLATMTGKLQIEPSLVLFPVLSVVSLAIAVVASFFDARLTHFYESIGSRFQLHKNVA